MKINILMPIVDTPKGGGNQFLKLLKKKLIEKGIYGELSEADVIVFNSYQNMENVINAKRKYPEKIFIHRVDGPIRLYNTMDDKRDYIINIVNKYIADATIFQSEWSRNQNHKMGIEQNLYEKVIYNAADESIFYPKYDKALDSNKKIQLIATSWSSNISKGFNVYKYLDDNLDWEKYEMLFVGNSPVDFDNIKHIEPLDSVALAEKLRESDIYISASKNDPCSNSVIEALNCGLPAICYNSGGHPELVKNGGLLFDDKTEIVELLEQITEKYRMFQDNISPNSSENISNQYINLADTIYNDVLEKKYLVKKISKIRAIEMKSKIKYWQKA